jgi:hypothetical protein
MMKSKLYPMVILILVLGFVLSGCFGNTQDSEQPDEVSDPLPPAAVVKARQALADTLGIGVEKVEILSYEAAEWSDSCLGLGGPAESCLLIQVNGWRVELSAEDKTYTARTDELGEAVRFEQ